MRLLDKYTLKEFLGPFLFGVAAFTAIFLGADTLLKIASYVTKYGASPVSALKIFILALPRIVAALLENNQTPDGIRIPEALIPYTGFDMIK